jgi:hypothetical protein
VNAMVSLITEATTLRRHTTPDYEEVIRSAADFVDGTIPYEISNQESLTTMLGILCIINAIVGNRKRLKLEMALRTHVLAMRCACLHGLWLSRKTWTEEPVLG